MPCPRSSSMLFALVFSLAAAAAGALEPLYPVAGSSDPAGLLRAPVRHPVQDEVLYFIIPDRFDNGDRANDCGLHPGPCPLADVTENILRHGYLPADRGYYHGGDIAGLAGKLDYLQGMGVTAVWVGPIFRNKPVQGDSTSLHGSSSGYHGYWITDFLAVDPHLGTNADFERLVGAAHERGIKVFMDIITNHTADVIRYAEGSYTYRSRAEHPYEDAEGETFDDADYQYAGQSGYTFPDMDLSGFPYTATVSEAEQGIKNPPWLNNPLYYHNRGNTTFSGENSLYGDFFGLDDLFTERREVVDGMVEIYRYWIERFGVDGFRIDTTKHVRVPFWQVFGPAMVEAATARGTPDFFAFGEAATTDPSFLALFSTEGRLQSTLDFAFQVAARAFASQSGATGDLEQFFAQDDYYIDADSNTYAMPTFVGNHDMGRIGYFLARVDQPQAHDAELVARSLLAHALMFFARGQPVIYYGDEQGFTGDGGDKLARQDMFASRVPEYNDDDLIGSDATTATENFDRSHPLYRGLAQYAALYHEHRALRGGAQIHRYATDSPGVYAFSRIDRSERVEYVVALNNSTAPTTTAVPTYYPEGVTFESILPARGKSPRQLRTGPGGELELTVAGLGLDIYRAARAVPPSAGAPAIEISTPGAGATITLRQASQDGHPFTSPLEVRAELDRTLFAEVTFAVREDGGPFRIIGTDDNPPYRVFYRVGDTAEDAELTFTAVVDDLSGNVNAASVDSVRIRKSVPAAVRRAMGEATFRYVPPPGRSVERVSLRGTMNDWAETPMSREPDGAWSVTVQLPAGEHRYKYFIDGEWPRDMAGGDDGQPLDAGAESYGDDGFGGRNAIRIVPAAEPSD